MARSTSSDITSTMTGKCSATIRGSDASGRVAKGERFGYGDRMRVELRTTFHRDSRGRLNLERTIPKVIDVEHATQPQASLFSDDDS